MSPQEYVDGVASQIRSIWDSFNISYDGFIRTTDKIHERTVQKIFKKLYEQGDIYKGTYEGPYCKPCESFWTESQLKDGCCPDCGAPVTRASEEAYYLRLSKYQDALEEYLNTHDGFIVPEARKNEMINNFIKPGSGPVRLPQLVQMGHTGGLRRGTCHLRMDRRAVQLYHGHRLRPGRQQRAV